MVARSPPARPSLCSRPSTSRLDGCFFRRTEIHAWTAPPRQGDGPDAQQLNPSEGGHAQYMTVPVFFATARGANRLECGRLAGRQRRRRSLGGGRRPSARPRHHTRWGPVNADDMPRVRFRACRPCPRARFSGRRARDGGPRSVRVSASADTACPNRREHRNGQECTQASTARDPNPIAM